MFSWACESTVCIYCYDGDGNQTLLPLSVHDKFDNLQVVLEFVPQVFADVSAIVLLLQRVFI